MWGDLGARAWSGGQTYVALFRVRRLDQLHLRRAGALLRDRSADGRSIRVTKDNGSVGAGDGSERGPVEQVVQALHAVGASGLGLEGEFKVDLMR